MADRGELYGPYGPYGVYGDGPYRGGYEGGGLRPGNSVLAAEAHANGTATKEAVDSNRDIYLQGQAGIRDSFEDARRAENFNRVCDTLHAMDSRTSRDVMETRQMMSDMKAEAAKCCCENKILILESENKIITQMKNDKIATLESQILTMQGQSNTQQILQAIASGMGCRFPGGGPPA